MDERILKTLYDILDSIEEVESYFQDMPRIFEVYRDTPMLRSAIHMRLSVIGEATNRILKLHPEVRISNARQIVNTRNYIIHGYDSLRPEMIWAIVINDLPKLKVEVSSLIESLGK